MKKWLLTELRLLLPYAGSGVTGFTLDVGLFWILLSLVHLHYLTATVLGFVFGTTAHFLLSRYIVFKHTTRSTHVAYVYFLTITSLGLAVISASMFCAVDLLGADPVFARISIGTLVGITSYFLHKRVSFQYHEYTSTP